MINLQVACEECGRLFPALDFASHQHRLVTGHAVFLYLPSGRLGVVYRQAQLARLAAGEPLPTVLTRAQLEPSRQPLSESPGEGRITP